jgi:hypothetical protein
MALYIYSIQGCERTAVREPTRDKWLAACRKGGFSELEAPLRAGVAHLCVLAAAQHCCPRGGPAWAWLGVSRPFLDVRGVGCALLPHVHSHPTYCQALPRIPANVSRKIVGAAMVAAVGSGGFFVYQRVVLGNPMRLGFDEEGVWSVVSRCVHVCPLVRLCWGVGMGWG